MPRLTTKADFARRAGVSKPAITKACKGPLAAACERDRVNLDHPLVVEYLRRADERNAPAAREPVTIPTPVTKPAPKQASEPTPVAKNTKKRVVAPTPVAKPAAKRASEPTAVETDDDAPSEAREARDLLPRGTTHELAAIAARIRPIVRTYGTVRSMLDCLRSLKEIEVINRTRLDNDERAGRLIDRELVQTHVFAALDGMARLLLTDSPKTIARRAYAMAKSGATAEEGERMVREIVESQLVHVRDKVVKLLEQTYAQVLRNAQADAAAELDGDVG
jgi:hypothetical protein